MKQAATVVLWVVVVSYACGAAVHLLSMLGLSGSTWRSIPEKWRVLDVAYLLLDVAVVVGLIRRSAVGYVAFYAAAGTQILLYTVFRGWVLDVPSEFAPTDEQRQTLDALVIFHCVAVVMVSLTLRYRGARVPCGGSGGEP